MFALCNAGNIMRSVVMGAGNKTGKSFSRAFSANFAHANLVLTESHSDDI